MLAIAVAVKLDSRGPVLYRQRRHGFNNRVITVLKFRTMRHEPDATLQQVRKDDPRVTRIGRFLRRTSLDELPQLINVLQGEMSLVGPRPHAIGMKTAERELSHIVAEYAHRHRVKPGITGWAQVNGSRGPLETPARCSPPRAARPRLRLARLALARSADPAPHRARAARRSQGDALKLSRLLGLAPLQIAQALVGFGAIAAFTRLMCAGGFRPLRARALRFDARAHARVHLGRSGGVPLLRRRAR